MRSVLRLLAPSLLLPVATLHAQSTDSVRAATITTAGTARRDVRPDLATVSVQISGTGPTAARAGARLAAAAAGIRGALATLGIPGDSVVNRGRWWWWRDRFTVKVESQCLWTAAARRTGRCRPVSDTTYTASGALEIRIRDLARVGTVLDTLMGRSLTDIANVRFSALDVTAAKQQALADAERAAHAAAESIAAAEGMELGRILSLSTERPGGERYERVFSPQEVTATGAEQGNAGPPAGTVVMAPSVPVSVTVYGRWELVKRP